MLVLRIVVFHFLLVLFPLCSYAQAVPDSLAVNQLHMLTYEHVLSSHYHSWSIQYREFEKETNDFVIPVTFSFGNTKIDGNFLENKKINTVDTYTFGLGFDGYEYLGSGFYLNLGVGVSPGVETIERYTGHRDTKFLIGGSANTGLLYVPFSDFGLVIGLKILGRLSNSRVINRSLGFGIETGINF